MTESSMTQFPDLVNWAWAGVLYWLVLGFGALLLQRQRRLLTSLVFPLGALGALFMAGVGLVGLVAPPSAVILPIGLPDLPFHLRLDALSAFFLVLLGGASFGVTVYAVGYFRNMRAGPLGLLQQDLDPSLGHRLAIDDGDVLGLGSQRQHQRGGSRGQGRAGGERDTDHVGQSFG